MKSTFGIKSHKVVEDNIVEVEFLNGRIYQSKWYGDKNGKYIVSSSLLNAHYEDTPREEKEMEYCVAEYYCHILFNPALKG